VAVRWQPVMRESRRGVPRFACSETRDQLRCVSGHQNRHLWFGRGGL